MAERRQNAGQVLDAVLEASLDAVKVIQQRIRAQDAEGNSVGPGSLQDLGGQIQYDAAKHLLDRAAPLIHELNEVVKSRAGQGF